MIVRRTSLGLVGLRTLRSRPLPLALIARGIATEVQSATPAALQFLGPGGQYGDAPDITPLVEPSSTRVTRRGTERLTLCRSLAAYAVQLSEPAAYLTLPERLVDDLCQVRTVTGRAVMRWKPARLQEGRACLCVLRQPRCTPSLSSVA